MQFKIKSALLVVTAVALLCAMAARIEIEMLLKFLVGIQILSIVCAIQHRRNLYVLGSSVAILLATIPVASLALYEFLTAPKYNEQLYHEDGPQVFVALCLITLLLLSVFGTALVAVSIFVQSWIGKNNKTRT